MKIVNVKDGWYFVTGIDKQFSGWIEVHRVTTSPAEFQDFPPQQVRTKGTIPLYLGRSTKLPTGKVIPAGTALEIVEENAGWYFVKDGSQDPAFSGWVEGSLITSSQP